MIELKDSLCFMTKLSKTRTQARHLLPAFVRDVGLVRVDLPQQQIHIYERLVELLLQYLQPAEHRHTRGRGGEPPTRRGSGGSAGGGGRGHLGNGAETFDANKTELYLCIASFFIKMFTFSDHLNLAAQ